jgi:hypothetical protein
MLQGAQNRMATVRIDARHGFCRQLTSWIAIYALALQGILVGLTGTHLDPASGFELCHSERSATTSGGAPAEDLDDLHCPLCALGGDDGAPLTIASIPIGPVAEGATVPWPVSSPPVTNASRHSGNRSRAPPVAA